MIGQRTKAICEKIRYSLCFQGLFLIRLIVLHFNSFRGPGIEEGLKILAQIKKRLECTCCN